MSESPSIRMTLAETSPDPGSSDGAEMRILLVEDSVDDARLVQLVLENAGVSRNVVTAPSVRRAREFLAEHTPDLVITDLCLPDGSGAELLPDSANDAKWPIILLTGQDDEQTAALAAKSGAMDYVVKSCAALEAMPQIVGRVMRAWQHVAERRNTEMTSRLRGQALEVVANGVVMTDVQGAIIWANPAFSRLTGYTLNEVVGRNPRVLKSGCHDEGLYRDLWQTILSGRVWHGSMVNRRKDGTTYHEEMTITPVLDAVGQVSHFVAIKQDVTERKATEEALRRYAQELEEANRAAVEARREAERANQVKSEFLAKMSHELRTPLNSIIGFTELMIDDKQDPPPEKRAARLEKVHRNGKNLLALINDILDLSKIEAERLVVDRQPVEVATVVSECAESAQPLVRGKPVELRCRIEPDLQTAGPWIGDEVRLRQVVTNLLGNAAKFTDRGGIEIRAFLEGDDLCIAVEDTGIGISAEDLDKVFAEFEQVDSSSTRRAGGTGLGLAICDRLCRLMGGSIHVTSKPGVGSCFTIRFPMNDATPSPPGHRANTTAQAVQ